MRQTNAYPGYLKDTEKICKLAKSERKCRHQNRHRGNQDNHKDIFYNTIFHQNGKSNINADGA